MPRFKTPRIPTVQPPVQRTANDKQKYPMLKQGAMGRIRTYEFRYPPTNIQFDSLAPEWVEVERPGLVPIVGLRQYRLMRVQFEFLVSRNFDGIWQSVDDELYELRRMAVATDPVFFLYMDKVMTVPVNLPGANRATANGMFFRIVEFNINSLRRNTDNQITAAQCSMTLQEDFNLAIKAVSMPAIEYPPIVKPRVSKPKGDNQCTLQNQAACKRDPISEILAGLSVGF